MRNITSSIVEVREEDLKSEDGGCAIILQEDFGLFTYSDDRHVFLRLYSWDEETKEHKEIRGLIGKKIQITMRVLDDDQSSYRYFVRHRYRRGSNNRMCSPIYDRRLSCCYHPDCVN